MHSRCFSKHWINSYYVQYSRRGLVKTTKDTTILALIDFIFYLNSYLATVLAYKKSIIIKTELSITENKEK